MEAANMGCKRGNGLSIGIYMEGLSEASKRNEYLDEPPSMLCHHFFVRKLAFLQYSSAVVCFPGGTGTLEELFDFLSMRTVGYIPPIPIYLMGSSFWEGILRWLEDFPIKNELISPEELEGLYMTDDPVGLVKRISKQIQVTRKT